MQSLPGETLGVLGQFLTLKEILALATTNADFQKTFVKPSMNKQLAEYYGFPYGLTLVELKEYESMSLDNRLQAAAKIGDLRVVNKLVELGATDFDAALIHASYFGHENIVDRAIELGAEDFDIGMIQAALGGHLKLFNKFVALLQENDELSKKDINDALKNASWKNREEIVNRCIELGADNFVKALKYAAMGGHLQMVNKIAEILKSKSQLDEDALNLAMAEAAASEGHFEVVERLIELGANDLDMALSNAASNGHMEIVKKMVSLGAYHFYWPIIYATLSHHNAIVDFLIDEAIKNGNMNFNINKIFVEAAKVGNEEILRKMIQMGAKDFYRAIAIAKRKGHENIVKILQEYI